MGVKVLSDAFALYNVWLVVRENEKSFWLQFSSILLY